MADIQIKKITEGLSGYQSAGIIYDNDTALKEKIQEVSEQFEANKAYVGIINSGGTQTLISVEQNLGTSRTNVMSQNAVNTVVEGINSELGEVAHIAEIAVEDASPLTKITSATTAEKAATDMEGHSLTKMYNDIEEIKDVMVMKGEIIEDYVF